MTFLLPVLPTVAAPGTPGMEAVPSPRPSPSPSAGARGESQQQQQRPSSASPAAETQQGSRALNRFDTDPVVYSTYEQDGKPLEVDPD